MIDISDLPRRVSALTESSPEIDKRLTELARLVARRVRSAPAFDAAWTAADVLPSAMSAAAAPPPGSGTSELTLDADAITALLKTERRSDALEAARKMLPTLRRERDFAGLLKVAGAIYQHDPHDQQTAVQYARAMIETGDLVGAQKLLAPLVKKLRGEREFSQATGLLGRVYKQQFAASASKRTAAARAAVTHAIDIYRAGYERNRRINLFHGVNLVALIAAARRHDLKIARPLNERALARKILSELEKRPESLRGPWDYASAAELQLALGDWEAFARTLDSYTSHPQFESVELNAFLRQLTDVWELESDPVHGAPHIAALRARVLSTPGGSVDLRPEVARAAPPTVPDRLRLERSFSADRFRTLTWYEQGLASAKSVGVVLDSSERRIGTCFLVPARDLGVGRDECLVMTAAHIVSSRAQGSLKPKDTSIRLDVLNRRFDVAEELWTSPIERLDATVLRLHHPPTDVDGLRLAPSLPSRDEPSRVYIIGHTGGQLTFSLQDNELLDHEGPPDGTPATPGVVRLHYRAPTESGSSGSPVFDDEWRVIALHHLANPSVARLNGQAGTYSASEGIWIQSIIAAVKAAR